MNWKNLWNKKYALLVFYILLAAFLYHIGIQILDHFSGVGDNLQNMFSWLPQVMSPLFFGFFREDTGEK